MGVAVVPLVIATVKIGVVEADYPCPPGPAIVTVALVKGGAVTALVHGAEAKGQSGAQQSQGRQAQHQGQSGLAPQPATHQDQGQMAPELTPTSGIGTAIEQCQAFGGN